MPPPGFFEPRQVLLFSGHRIDSPGRAEPRFTPEMLPAAKRRMDEVLDKLQAGRLDLALCQAAAGGDLLFLESCHSRGVRCEVLLPFDEPEFVRKSIQASLGGESWLRRWLALKPGLANPPRILPAEAAPAAADADAYERCNRWLLATALGYGPDKLRFVCLWNGQDGDGPGGVRHMIDEVRRRTGQVFWIDTRRLR